MMSGENYIKHCRQRGDALLEALIGILLMSVVGLGLIFSLTRMFKVQRYTTTQTTALVTMRNLVATTNTMQSLCVPPGGVQGAPHAIASLPVPGSTSPSNTVSIMLTCPAAATITVGTTGFMQDVSYMTRISLATPDNNDAAKSLISGDGVLSLRQ